MKTAAMKIEKKKILFTGPKEFDSKNLNYAFYTEYPEAGIFLKQECNGSLSEKDWAEVQIKIGQVINTAFLGAANNKGSVQRILDYGNRMSGFFKEIQARQFSVCVCYPGLLIGTGYPHITKQIKGEIQAGTLFDWTTGAPYYSGSSVKGVLRHLFKVASGKSVEAEECRKELSERINRVSPGFNQILTREDCRHLERVIFENAGVTGTKPNIFYDAYIVGFRKNSGYKNRILGMDSLAPHKDILKDPNPISMLRILPDVCMTFSMRLRDVNDRGGNTLLTSEQLLALFKNIILDLGFGAKTHTGYGVVKEIKETDIDYVDAQVDVKRSRAVQLEETEKEPEYAQKEPSGEPVLPDFRSAIAETEGKQTIKELIESDKFYADNQTEMVQSEIDQVYENPKMRSVKAKKTQSDGPICPKCGSDIVDTGGGHIRCLGDCGMLYGKIDGEDLSLDQIRVLLSGDQIETRKGKILSINLDDSIDEFTNYKGVTKYRLKILQSNEQ